MCGIAGIWQTQDNVNPDTLSRMLATLRHRGPDDEGYWRAGTIGLAQRRLAILDLSAAGHQPMATPDGRWHLVFNGEIFNYRELARERLADLSFMSTSDTEVLLHLLARHGERTFDWLRGMYAVALWDNQEQRLLLARDPFGKKPLYYRSTAEGLWFASEPKAILAALAESPPLTPEAVSVFCSYEYVPAPYTPWAGVQHVPAGTYQWWTSPTDYTATRFWRPQFLPKQAEAEETLIKRLDELVQQSVRRRMIADVPVGLLLSGGLDSTTIGWYMRHDTAQPLHSFSVSFREHSFDETRYAERAAAWLKTKHHTLSFTLDRFKETLAELVPLVDIPLADASLLPTYAISKLARRYVTVVLDGDGSDELFGGYGTFQAATVAERLQWMKPLLPAVKRVAELLPTSYHDFSFDFKVKSFLRGLAEALPERNQIWLGSFNQAELTQLLQPAWYREAAVQDAITLWRSELKGLGVIDQVSLATIYHYLQNDILVKLDRATMYTSVEARTPFLDVDVADFALRLPEKYKKNKYILKRVMAGRLPAEIVQRRKKGFGIPLGLWLRGPLYKWGRSVLNPETLREDGIFKVEYVERLWREHKTGRADHRKKLWTLLSFQLWYDEWVIGRPSRISRPLERPKAR